jgi:hypothetical protein
VLVKFVEIPKYRCPLATDQDPEELEIPLDLQAIRPRDMILRGEYGPTYYKGLRWVGEITEVNMETWVRDIDGTVVQRGNREDLLHTAQTQIFMGDFLPPGYPPTITLNLDRFRLLLRREIKELAVKRCREVVIRYRERMGEGRGDRDYQP